MKKIQQLHNHSFELVSVIYISNWFILICIFLPISFEMCEADLTKCNTDLCPGFPDPLLCRTSKSTSLNFMRSSICTLCPGFQLCEPAQNSNRANCKLQLETANCKLPFRKLAWFHPIKELSPFGKLLMTCQEKLFC